MAEEWAVLQQTKHAPRVINGKVRKNAVITMLAHRYDKDEPWELGIGVYAGQGKHFEFVGGTPCRVISTWRAMKLANHIHDLHADSLYGCLLAASVLNPCMTQRDELHLKRFTDFVGGPGVIHLFQCVIWKMAPTRKTCKQIAKELKRSRINFEYDEIEFEARRGLIDHRIFALPDLIE